MTHKETQVVKAEQEEQAVVAQEPSPATILSRAVESGVDPEGLEKLADLYERMEARQAKKLFFQALTAFQAELPDIPHDKEAGQGNFKYEYTSLGQLRKHTQPLLEKQGLSYRFDTRMHDGKYMEIICYLTHEAGHSEQSSMTLPIDSGRMNNIQQFGSTDSYGRRYVLLNALGITTAGSDNDAQMPPQPEPHHQRQTKPVKQRQTRTQTKEPPSADLRKKFHAIGNELYPETVTVNDKDVSLWDVKRPGIIEAVTKQSRGTPVTSSKELTADEMSKITKMLENKLDQWNSLEVQRGDQSPGGDGMKHYVTVKQGNRAFRIFADDQDHVRCPCRKGIQKTDADNCLHVRKAIHTYSEKGE